MVEMLFASDIPQYMFWMFGTNEICLDCAAVVGYKEPSRALRARWDDGEEESEELFRHCLVNVGSGSFRGLAITFQIYTNTVVGAGERGHLMVPLVPAICQY